MKVKELIEILSKLDQEKNIKTVVADGYEYKDETGTPEVREYKEFWIASNNGGYYGIEMAFDDPDRDNDNTDFYVLT